MTDAEQIAILTRQRDELRVALATILKGFEDGVFVRDVTKDGSSDWAVKLLPFLISLGKAQAALAGHEELAQALKPWAETED